MKKLIFILTFLIGFSGIGQNSALFEEANKAYASGDFQQAVDLYSKILNSGETSAEVHYNLANAHYKLNHIAPSIYHYEKALQLDPGDEDIRNNLNFARNMAIDAIDEGTEEGFSRLFATSTAAFTPSGWGWAAIACMLAFLIFFLFYYFSRRSITKRILFISSMFLLLLAISSALIGFLKIQVQQENSFAIVFAEEVEVRNEPSLRGAEVFTLHEGAKVEITEDFQDWVEIQLPNGSRGWMPKTEIKRL